MNMNRAIRLALLVALLAALLFAARGLYRDLIKNIDVETVSVPASPEVVLSFWASWCPPCKAELPDFDAACSENPDICFMMVNLTDGSSETVETASSFIESNGYSFPVYYDTDYDAANVYGVMSIPMTVFIDAEGHVRTYSVGMISSETLEEGIALIR